MLIIFGHWKEIQELYASMKEMVLSQQEKRNWKKVRQNTSYSYGGHPFGGSCVAERNKDFSQLKQQLIDEINAIGFAPRCYTNAYLNRKEVRINLGYFFVLQKKSRK